MKIYKNRIKVRWSDLDPNLHLANSAYMSFTSASRMEALEDMGLSLKNMHRWGVGPVIFTENFQFFREIMPSTTIVIHTKVVGLSDNGVLFEFQHDLYDLKGDHKATSKIFGSWIDLKARKIATQLPEEMAQIISEFRSETTHNLSMADIKNLPAKPQPISPDSL